MIQKQIQEMLDHQSIIRTSDVVKKGIPKPYLNRMVENGQLIKVARGIYITDWSQYDEYAIFQLQHKKSDLFLSIGIVSSWTNRCYS